MRVLAIAVVLLIGCDADKACRSLQLDQSTDGLPFSTRSGLSPFPPDPTGYPSNFALGPALETWCCAFTRTPTPAACMTVSCGAPTLVGVTAHLLDEPYSYVRSGPPNDDSQNCSIGAREGRIFSVWSDRYTD